MLTRDDAERQNELILELEEGLQAQQENLNNLFLSLHAYLQHLQKQIESLETDVRGERVLSDHE